MGHRLKFKVHGEAPFPACGVPTTPRSSPEASDGGCNRSVVDYQLLNRKLPLLLRVYRVSLAKESFFAT